MAPLPLSETWIMESIGFCQRLKLTRRHVGSKSRAEKNTAAVKNGALSGLPRCYRVD